jgi:hypothetical protein
MPSTYFQKFPKIAYDVTGTGNNLIVVTDIIHRAKFLDVVRANTILLYDYVVQDRETPDIIASKLYGSSIYHWVVLFANDIFCIWTDWPLHYDEFIAYLTKVYGSPETSMTTVHHYEDKYGAWIDYDSYLATLSDGSVQLFAYDYENNLNEAKKFITLLDPQYLFRVESELEALLLVK